MRAKVWRLILSILANSAFHFPQPLTSDVTVSLIVENFYNCQEDGSLTSYPALLRAMDRLPRPRGEASSEPAPRHRRRRVEPAAGDFAFPMPCVFLSYTNAFLLCCFFFAGRILQ